MVIGVVGPGWRTFVRKRWPGPPDSLAVVIQHLVVGVEFCVALGAKQDEHVEVSAALGGCVPRHCVMHFASLMIGPTFHTAFVTQDERVPLHE